MSFESRPRIRVWCEDVCTSAWLLVPNTALSVASVTRSVVDKLGLAHSDAGYDLFLNDSLLLSSESAALIRDGDHISVRPRDTRELSTRARFPPSATDAAIGTVTPKPQPNLDIAQNNLMMSFLNKRALEEAPVSAQAKKMKLGFQTTLGVSIAPAPRRETVKINPRELPISKKRSPFAPIPPNTKTAAFKPPIHVPVSRNPSTAKPPLSKPAPRDSLQAEQLLSRPPLSRSPTQKPTYSELPASNISDAEPPLSKPSDSKLHFSKLQVPKSPFSNLSATGPPLSEPAVANAPLPSPPLSKPPFSKPIQSKPPHPKPSALKHSHSDPKLSTTMNRVAKFGSIQSPLQDPLDTIAFERQPADMNRSTLTDTRVGLTTETDIERSVRELEATLDNEVAKHCKSGQDQRSNSVSISNSLPPRDQSREKSSVQNIDSTISDKHPSLKLKAVYSPSTPLFAPTSNQAKSGNEQASSYTTTPVTPSSSKRNPPILRSKPSRPISTPMNNIKPPSRMNRKAQFSPETPKSKGVNTDELPSKSRDQRQRLIAKFARPSFMDYAPKTIEKSTDNVIDVDRLDTKNKNKNKLVNSKQTASSRSKKGGNGRSGTTDVRENSLDDKHRNESRNAEFQHGELTILKATSDADNIVPKGAVSAKPQYVSNEKKSIVKKPESSSRKAQTKLAEVGPIENKLVGRVWTILDALKKKAESNGQDLYCQAQVRVDSMEGGRKPSDWIQFMLKIKPTARNELQLSIVNTEALEVLQKVGRHAKQRIPGTASVKTGANLRPNMPILLHASAICKFTFDEKTSERGILDEATAKQPESRQKQGIDKKSASQKESFLDKLAALSKSPSGRRDSNSTKKGKHNSAVPRPKSRSQSPHGSSAKRPLKNKESRPPPQLPHTNIFSSAEPMELVPLDPMECSDALNNDSRLTTGDIERQQERALDVPFVKPQSYQNKSTILKANSLTLDDLSDMVDLPVPTADDLPLAGDEELPSLSAVDSVLDTSGDRNDGKSSAKPLQIDLLHNSDPPEDHQYNDEQKTLLPAHESNHSMPKVLSRDSVIDLVESDSSDVVSDIPPAPKTDAPQQNGLDDSMNDYGVRVLEMLSDVADTIGVLTSRKDLYID